MDIKSILGYSSGSPFRNMPYIDIHTPNKTIDMSKTDIPLLAKDETGMSKVLAPFSGTHKFRGTRVREIPMKKGGPSPEKAHEMLRDGTANGKKLTKKQKRYFGWIYGNSKKQMGGLTSQDAIDFLFEDDEQPQQQAQQPLTIDDVEEMQKPAPPENDEDYLAALDIAMGEGNSRAPRRPNSYGNGYKSGNVQAQQPGQSAEFAFNYLQEKGLSPHVAAGIVGNLTVESGLNTTATGDGGLAKGIAQWHPDRFSQLKSWASKSGRNPYSLEAQLDYVIREASQRGDLDAVESTKDAGEAAYLFAKRFERPKKIDNKRIGYAKALHPYKYGGKI